MFPDDAGDRLRPVQIAVDQLCSTHSAIDLRHQFWPRQRLPSNPTSHDGQWIAAHLATLPAAINRPYAPAAGPVNSVFSAPTLAFQGKAMFQ
jgi:hypothetical protein